MTLEQVAQWHDEQGHNGLWYVMQVVSQLLDPRTSEFTAAFVGRLVSTLISKAGRELGENLDQILRAILSKMQQAETLSVMQVGRGGSGRTALSPGPSLTARAEQSGAVVACGRSPMSRLLVASRPPGVSGLSSCPLAPSP